MTFGASRLRIFWLVWRVVMANRVDRVSFAALRCLYVDQAVRCLGSRMGTCREPSRTVSRLASRRSARCARFTCDSDMSQITSKTGLCLGATYPEPSPADCRPCRPSVGDITVLVMALQSPGERARPEDSEPIAGQLQAGRAMRRMPHMCLRGDGEI